jgi:SecDF, P1 head subdomain
MSHSAGNDIERWPIGIRGGCGRGKVGIGIGPPPDGVHVSPRGSASRQSGSENPPPGRRRWTASIQPEPPDAENQDEMLREAVLVVLGRRHRARRADYSWPAGYRTVVCVFVLAVAAASCGASRHASTSPSAASPSASPSPLAEPDFRRLAMQQRPVLGIVYYGSPAWKGTALTCAPRDDPPTQCVAQTLDRDRIVLVGPRRDKYILGPVVFDGSDVLRAVAIKQIGFQPGWVVDFRLTAEATQRLADATKEAVGKQLAIIVDGQVVSAPVVASPILNGAGSITGSFDEERAQALAAQLSA